MSSDVQPPKRRKMAFATDVDMPARDTDAYRRWASWRDESGDISFAFMSAEECGVIAAQFHAQFFFTNILAIYHTRARARSRSPQRDFTVFLTGQSKTLKSLFFDCAPSKQVIGTIPIRL